MLFKSEWHYLGSLLSEKKENKTFCGSGLSRFLPKDSIVTIYSNDNLLLGSLCKIFILYFPKDSVNISIIVLSHQESKGPYISRKERSQINSPVHTTLFSYTIKSILFRKCGQVVGAESRLSLVILNDPRWRILAMLDNHSYLSFSICKNKKRKPEMSKYLRSA